MSDAAALALQAIADEPDPVGFGLALQAFRAEMGITQARMALSVGLTDRTIRRIEAGLPVTRKTMRSIATAAMLMLPCDLTDETVWDLLRERHPAIYRSFIEAARLIMEKPDTSQRPLEASSE